MPTPKEKLMSEEVKDQVAAQAVTPAETAAPAEAAPTAQTPDLNISDLLAVKNKYITPLEKQTKYTFNTSGGIGSKMVSDNDMIKILQSAKICPILHAPSWQAERGIQDRFYTVFISGRFGICDNLGAIDLTGASNKNSNPIPQENTPSNPLRTFGHKKDMLCEALFQKCKCNSYYMYCYIHIDSPFQKF
jgi:hypothetical protein